MISGISWYIHLSPWLVDAIPINQTLQATSFRAPPDSDECHQPCVWLQHQREQSLNIKESTGEMENFWRFGLISVCSNTEVCDSSCSPLSFFSYWSGEFQLDKLEGGDMVERCATYIKVLRNATRGRKDFLAAVNPFIHVSYLFVLCHSVLSRILQCLHHHMDQPALLVSSCRHSRFS